MKEPLPNYDSPQLSVVAAARNDNHGGDLLRRMQMFVSGFLEQCRRHRLRAELILVEWNPPLDRPRLADALSWQSGPGYCPVRIIEVSPKLHSRYAHSDALPLFQMIAKNVGIRRARGNFVLATNVDIVFSDELIAFLASGQLEQRRMYRVDRYDVPADVPLEATLDEQLAYCHRNVIRIAGCDGTRNLLTGHYHAVFPKRTLHRRLHQRAQDWRLAPVVQRSWLHTNACGDFTLMARQHWHDLRGYPELAAYSMHLDSVLCYAAFHSGVQEHVLLDPCRIYHLEHAAGSGWTPEGQAGLNARLAEAGIPSLDDAQLEDLARQMRRERKPLIPNQENWGLADFQLPESILDQAGAARPKASVASLGRQV